MCNPYPYPCLPPGGFPCGGFPPQLPGPFVPLPPFGPGSGLPTVSFTPAAPFAGATLQSLRTCKPVIPPWKGHHGGVYGCFGGDGRLTSFVEVPERPGVVDPF